MIYHVNTIPLRADCDLQLGFSVWLGEPSISLLPVIAGKPNFGAMIAIPLSKLDFVVASLTAAGERARGNDPR